MVGSVEVSSGYVRNGRRKKEEAGVVVGGGLEGRCVRRTMGNCVAVKEPDSDEEETGEGEARMAGVLARYRASLLERSKHHLATADALVPTTRFGTSCS